MDWDKTVYILNMKASCLVCYSNLNLGMNYSKASFRGGPLAHPDWIVPAVDKEVEMKFQWTI